MKYYAIMFGKTREWQARGLWYLGKKQPQPYVESAVVFASLEDAERERAAMVANYGRGYMVTVGMIQRARVVEVLLFRKRRAEELPRTLPVMLAIPDANALWVEYCDWLTQQGEMNPAMRAATVRPGEYPTAPEYRCRDCGKEECECTPLAPRTVEENAAADSDMGAAD